MNWFDSDNGVILPFFYISGRMSVPEVEHVMFDVHFYFYLRVLKDLVHIPRSKIVKKLKKKQQILW